MLKYENVQNEIFLFDCLMYRFYDAMPGNTWLINATEYGHGDGMNQFFLDAIEVLLCYKPLFYNTLAHLLGMRLTALFSYLSV